jgi:hypothetical protein
MQWGRIVLDVVGIAVLVAVGGLVVSSLWGAGQGGVPMPAVAASNLVLSTLGFVLAGARTREQRGRHLFTVAAGVWLLGALNVPLLGISATQWLVSALAILVACVVGGAIASAVFPSGRAGL